MKLSVVIPVYNETASLEELFKRLKKSLSELVSWYEIIFVDDGSKDETPVILEQFCAADPSIARFIKFPGHFGKTAALIAGFKETRGDIIVTMDADLQDMPEEIPLFLDKVKEGYDLVCGWRFRRKDIFIKVALSRIFNFFLRLIFRTKLHDVNCGFKAFRREVIDAIDLHSEEQRLFPVMVAINGFRVTEIKTTHFKRRFGKSKYPLFRFRAFFDLWCLFFFKRKYC